MRGTLCGRGVLVVFAAALLFGCRSLTGATVPDALELRAERHLAALSARHDAVTGLRARARSEVDGASGEAFSRQLLLLERPARLRIEVMGLLGQRALVLATDGTHYDVFRAAAPGIERGTVHPGVLWEVAGVPLAPDAAVSLLLAAPEQPAGGARPKVSWDGGSGEAVIAFPDQTYRFDGSGNLRGYRWHPDGHDWVLARYDDWRGEGERAFPHRIALGFPSSGGSVEVALRDVELNPEFDAAVFRLPEPEPLSSTAEGDGG